MPILLLHGYLKKGKLKNALAQLDKAEAVVLSKEVDPETGCVPLHLIARYYNVEGGLSDEEQRAVYGLLGKILVKLVKLCPIAPTVRDKDGNLPLHYAISNTAIGFKPIKYILKVFAKSAEIPGKQEMLPIHLACKHGRDTEIIKLLYEQYPKGIGLKNRGGNLPLHCAVSSNKTNDVKLILYLLNCYPLAAEIRGKQGMLPIHMACKSKLSIEIIKLLGQTHPKGMEWRDESGRLPLHWVAATFQEPPLGRESHENCRQCALYLCQKYPQGILHRDNLLCMPLHTAAEMGLCDLVKSFLDHEPRIATEQDKDGNLLIHKLLHRHCGSPEKSLALKLIREHPEGLLHANQSGFLPIHLCGDDDLFSELVAACPKSLKVAAASTNNFPIVSYLLKYDLAKFRAVIVNRALALAFSDTDQRVVGYHQEERKRLVDDMQRRHDEVLEENQQLLQLLAQKDAEVKEEKRKQEESFLVEIVKLTTSFDKEKKKLEDSFLLEKKLLSTSFDVERNKLNDSFLEERERLTASFDNEKKTLIKSLGLYRKLASQSIKLEKKFLEGVKHDATMEELKAYATFLKERLDTVKAHVAPEEKPSITQATFHLVISHPSLSRQELIDCIERLDSELTYYLDANLEDGSTAI